MRAPAATSLKANESCGDREELIKFRNAFAMIKTIGNHSQGKGLNLGNGFLTSLPVCLCFFDKNSLFGRLTIPKGELCVKEICPPYLGFRWGLFSAGGRGNWG